MLYAASLLIAVRYRGLVLEAEDTKVLSSLDLGVAVGVTAHMGSTYDRGHSPRDCLMIMRELLHLQLLYHIPR